MENIAILAKVLKVCGKYTYKQLAKNFIFYKALTEFGFEYPKDEFDSLYLNTCVLFASINQSEELLALFLLEETKNAFKQEVNHGKQGLLSQSINGNLHTHKLIKELKDLNKIPESVIENFFSIYNDLVKDVASPVSSEIMRNQASLSDKMSIGFERQINDFSEINQKLSLLIDKSDHQNSNLLTEYERQIKIIIKLMDEGLVNLALTQLTSLKQEIWEEAQDRIKFKILTNIGVCYYRQNRQKEASKYLIQAYDYQPESEIALSNLINAYLINGNRVKAKNHTDILFDKFPDSVQGFSALIRCQNDLKELEDIKINLPEKIKNEAEILLSLGISMRRFGEYNNSITLLSKSLELSANNPVYEEQLLASLLEKYSIDFKVMNLRFISKEAEKELNLALQIIDKQLLRYEKGDLVNLYSQLLMNKGIILSVLDKYDESMRVMDSALVHSKNDPKILRQKGMLNGIHRKHNEAKIIFEQIKDFSQVPDVPCFLAEIYLNDGQPEKGIKLIEDFIANDYGHEYKSQAKTFLLDIFIRIGNKSKIEELHKKEFQSDSLMDSIDRSKINRFFNRGDKAIEELLNIYQTLPKHASLRDKYLLAEAFLENNFQEKAIELLNQIVDPEVFNHLTVRLAKLYYSVGEKGECLKILKKLRKVHGVLLDVTSFEVSIYQEYRDYARAKKIANAYVKRFPADLSMKIRLAGLNFRLEKYRSVDQFLRENIEIKALSHEEIKVYLGQLMARNFRHKLFQTVYEYRRTKNDSDAHILYVHTLLQFPLTDEERHNTKMVIANSVVVLQDNNANKIFFIIEDKPKDELQENELNLSDERYNLLRNKAIGDEVLFRSASTRWKIIDIENKIVFAFHESQKKCETIYSLENPLISFNVEDFKEFLKDLEKQDRPWIENYQLAKDLYRNRKITIGLISSKFDKNPIIIWEEFANEQGVQCSVGGADELKDAKILVSQYTSVVADITGLLTAFELNLWTTLTKNFDKIYISVTTFDLIFELLQAAGLYTDSKKNLKLESFLNYVKNNAEQLVPQSIYRINSKEKQKQDEMFGNSFADSILLAKETNSLLYSDDYVFRNIANHKYSIDGIWTQGMLAGWLEQSKIDGLYYQEKLISLTQLNYFHTSIDKNTLLLSSRKADYLYNVPFIDTLKYLEGKVSTEDSSLIIAFEFLYQIWADDNVVKRKKENISHCTITSLCTNRVSIEVLEKLNYIIKLKARADRDGKNELICWSLWLQVRKWKKNFKIPERLF